MSWALGSLDGRWIGYGVPAVCDHPDCNKSIDRGLAYRCGDLEDAGCDLFFCGGHLTTFVEDDDPNGGGVWVCERCARGEPPFDPKPDTAEWIDHMLTDESWAQWREDHPATVASMAKAIS